MVLNREQAAVKAEAATTNVPDACQQWTRNIYGAPSAGDFDGDGASDAEDGWKVEGSHQHPGDRNPPRGVPVAYLGGSKDNGHRAISLGNGMIRSTDAGGRGKVATVPLNWPEKTWGLTYAGWSDTIDGVPIPIPPRQTRRAPGVRFYHDDTPVKFAGGTLGDSAAGTRDAFKKGFRRADANGHLMHRTGVGRTLGKADTDVVWVNAHGAPYLPGWMKKGQKFEDLVWLTTKLVHPRLRSARATFKQNAKVGIDTEWEVKDLHPLVSDATLDVAFRRLANAARAGYGADWQRHVVVKVLTDLGGGLDYALKICKHADAHGFDTMILPRGDDVHAVINEPFVTWNRGGKV